MREIEFKVERSGLIKEGDVLGVIETKMENYLYYTIEGAYGMSGNIEFDEAIKTRRGRVVKFEKKDRGFYATLEFED